MDKAPTPTDKEQTFYRDKKLKGFALRVKSAGTKRFIAEKITGKKVRRITLGKYDSLTAENARMVSHRASPHIYQSSRTSALVSRYTTAKE